MKKTYWAFALAALMLPGTLAAQSAGAPASETRGLRDQLMPSAATVALTKPAAAAETTAEELQPIQPVMAAGGSGVGYMIAGAALFVAGLLIESDAGTFVAVAGAAIGAYGLYIHFR